MNPFSNPIRCIARWCIAAGLTLGLVAGPAGAQEECDSDVIQAAYVGFYARAADPAGFAFWKEQVTPPICFFGMVAEAFGGSSEFDELFGGKTNTEIVQMVYRQLLGRAADQAGLNYYRALLDRRARTVPEVILDIFYGVTGERDTAVLANKIAAANYFTDQVATFGADYDDETKAETVAILDAVGESDADVETANAASDDYVSVYTPLAVVHINDHHSHLESNGGELTFDGVETDVEFGSFARVVTMIRELDDAYPKALRLHAGDAITGTIFFTSFKGEADADLMNEVCFDAFALGNHEFDDSDAGLARFLGFLNGDPELCTTPVLAANVVPALGTPLRPDAETSLIQPYVILERFGQTFGIIGIDIADKTRNSSSPLDTTEFLDETETAQAYIDELTAMGVDKIILLTHYGYGNDMTLASNVTGADIIVGGDSHSLLGDTFADFGLSPKGPYPTEVESADGAKVCVVQAWEYTNVVGELVVGFDREGKVRYCDGTPHLLLADSFQRDDVELEGDDRQAVLDIIAATPELDIVEADAMSEAILEPYAEQLEELRTTLVGEANADLCLERVPGQGRSSIPGCTEATRGNGGDIQQLVTQAFLLRSLRADVAIQNAGGIRIDVPAGDISIDTVFTLLPFANTLVEFDMTGAEVKQVINDAINFYLSNPSGNSGAYPYAANLRWDLDLSQPEGSRFSNIEIRRKGSSEWVPLADDDAVVVVTNSFVAAGGDNYVTFRELSDQGRVVDTFIDYAQGFIDYMQQDVGGASPGDDYLEIPPVVTAVPCDDYSTQTFINADGELQLPEGMRACEMQ